MNTIRYLSWSALPHDRCIPRLISEYDNGQRTKSLWVFCVFRLTVIRFQLFLTVAYSICKYSTVRARTLSYELYPKYTVPDIFLLNRTVSYRSCTPAEHLATCVLLYCSDNLIGGSVVDIYITIKIKIIVIVTTSTEILIRVNRMYIMFIFRVRKYSFTKEYLVIQLHIHY